jgi:hypothetical protein
MDIEEEYKELVTGHLESLSTQFEEELSRVSHQAFPEEVKFLKIEYDSPTFSDNFSVYMFAMNKKGKLVGDVYWFLENKAVVVPSEIYEAEKYDEIEPWETASNILEEWLIMRWKNAGNMNYPAYLAHHDSYFMRNIANGSDTNWDKIIEASNG